MALGVLWALGFNALRRRTLTGLPLALEDLFIASTHGWERGIVAGPESTGHGLQCFGVAVERRDILRRYTSAGLLRVIRETQVAARLRQRVHLGEP